MGKRVGCQKHSEIGVHLIYGKCIPLPVFSGWALYFQDYLGGKEIVFRIFLGQKISI